MNEKEIYALSLCIVVLAMMLALFAVLVIKLIKTTLKMMRAGGEDEKIVAEYTRSPSRAVTAMNTIATIVISIVLLFAIVSTLVLVFTESQPVGDVPMLKVVKSGSMAKKHQRNSYLVDDDLNNQIATNDLVVMHKMPPEDELKLYDIVMYEREGELIMHRIVYISLEDPLDPNSKRMYLTQGDAVPAPDNKMVEYSQMRGIYRDEHVPLIGSFVMFMQSPAGMICLVIIAIVTLTIPLIDKAIAKTMRERLSALGYINAEADKDIDFLKYHMRIDNMNC